MIVKYGLFDPDLQAEDIELTRTQKSPSKLNSGLASEAKHEASGFIEDGFGDQPNHSGRNSRVQHQSARTSAAVTSRSRQAELRSPSGQPHSYTQMNTKQDTHTDRDQGNVSPRSTHSNMSKLLKKKQKLSEIKQEAIEKLEGLPAFQFMIWSKQKFSMYSDDNELLDQFNKRFKSCLPLKHIDMVLISSTNSATPL